MNIKEINRKEFLRVAHQTHKELCSLMVHVEPLDKESFEQYFLELVDECLELNNKKEKEE